jgi:preprotein translocase subunit SecB
MENNYHVINVMLVDSSFHRAAQFNSEINIDVDIQTDIGSAVDENNIFNVGLSAKVVGKNNNEELMLDVFVKMVGVFEIIGKPELPFENFTHINAQAIIYPYLREHISYITLKAGIPPVILPILNKKATAEKERN